MKRLLTTLTFVSALSLGLLAQENAISLANTGEEATAELLFDANYSAPAVFPGGAAALNRYVEQNLEYPKQALDQLLEGEVILRAVINTDGNISEVAILNSPHDVLSKAAKKLVENMPSWRPAYRNGKVVESRVMLPIRFGME